jgi:hypothetical protein
MRLTRQELEEIGEIVRRLCHDYATKGKGELPTDRVFYGYLRGRFPKAQLRRQFRQRRIENGKPSIKKIDFHLGSKSAGTFIELVVRRTGEEWRHGANDSELNKLCRIRSPQAQRSLLIIDITKKAPLERDKLKAEYKGWKSTRGQFQRNNVCVSYVGKGIAFSFTLRIKKGRVAVGA